MILSTLGPTGGKGGNAFADYMAPENGRIAAVHIYADRYIDAIQLEYETENGEHALLPKIGGLGGELHVFALDEDEWIVGISGESGWYVDALTIHTNTRRSPTYGGQGTQEFFFLAARDSQVVGFFGRADWYLDAIGVYTRPLPANLAPDIETPGEPHLKHLQRVKGIGAKVAGLLAANGICNLAELAQTPVETLQTLLADAGRGFSAKDPATWPQQAAQLVAEAGDLDA